MEGTPAPPRCADSYTRPEAALSLPQGDGNRGRPWLALLAVAEDRVPSHVGLSPPRTQRVVYSPPAGRLQPLGTVRQLGAGASRERGRDTVPRLTWPWSLSQCPFPLGSAVGVGAGRGRGQGQCRPT